MAERKFDQTLQIRTTGLREWKKGTGEYNRYEATPYQALEQLSKHYKLEPNDQVVDFGSGKGRVAFYIHHRFNIPITGVENNDETFGEALDNKMFYRRKFSHLDAPIRFEYGLAEQYEVQAEDNVFYFFNPFTLKIFKKVIFNILQSVEQHPRPVDIVFYYPLPEIKYFLKTKTNFKLMNKVRAYEDHGKYGKFLIYRLQLELVK